MQDIGSGIEVGVENNSTCFTDEGRALSLPLINIPTDGACSGRILCSDKLDSNTSFFSLIEKELLQLIESPIGEQPILLSSMSCFPNAIKFLQNDYSVFSYAIYQSSADNMVDITHKPLLLLLDFGKMPISRTSVFALQSASQTDISILDRKNVRAIVQPAIRCGYKIIDASVYPKHLSLFAGCDSRFFYGNHQPKASIPASDKIAFLDIPIGIFLEVFGDGECELDSTFLSEKTCRSFGQVYGTTSFIIMDGCSREFRLSASFLPQCSLDRSTGTFIGHYCKLGRKTETFPENWVVDMVHPEGIGFLMLIAGRNSEILSLRHQSHIIIKYGSLLRSFFNKRLDGFHHIDYILFTRIKKNAETPQFLPPVKGVGFLAVI